MSVQQARIYVIDGDGESGPLVVEHLRGAGYGLVTLFDDGLAGLNAALTNPPDLAILDRSLPTVSGEEICRVLSTCNPGEDKVPVIIYAESPEACQRQMEMLRISAAAYLEKPVDREALLFQVGKLLGSLAMGTPAPAPPPSSQAEPDSADAWQVGKVFEDLGLLFQQGGAGEGGVQEAKLDSALGSPTEQDPTPGPAFAKGPGNSGVKSTTSSRILRLDADGQSFSGYEIMDIVGSGAAGAVYKARQLSVDRMVALKVLLKSNSDTSDSLARFQKEARIMGKLNSPGIVQIYDVGETEYALYIAMEYIEGGSLNERLNQDSIDDIGARAIALGVCEAISYVHARGIVHGDIKPLNILVTKDDQAKLGDFGISRAMSPGYKLELTRLEPYIMGTPWFMAPEMFNGQAADDLTDQYALAKTIWLIFSKRTPDKEVPLLSEVRPDLPAALSHALARGMAKERENRFPSVAALHEAIKSAFTLVEARSASAGAEYPPSAASDEFMVCESNADYETSSPLLQPAVGAAESEDSAGPEENEARPNLLRRVMRWFGSN